MGTHSTGGCIALFAIWLGLLNEPVALAAADSIQVGQTVQCRQGAVASVSREASTIGVEMMQRGGNAVDAAVAVAFALAVSHPAAGNLGGGGYMLIAPPGQAPVAIDFREVAPLAATEKMFVDPAGRTPHRRVGVPGTVGGLWLAQSKYGKLLWRDVVRPAVELAKSGSVLNEVTANSLNGLLRSSDAGQFAELHRVYGSPHGRPWQAGDRLVQPDLASTLQLIADDGHIPFYVDKVAEQIVAEMRRGGGLIERQDLANYRPIARIPVVGTYRGNTIVGAPPSSSGGTVLIEMLNILENFDLAARERTSPENLHLMIEAMKRAYRDRAAYLADPDFATVPAHLTDKQYAKTLAGQIELARATPSRDLAGDIPIVAEGEHTTHFSVIDKDRMAVSLTYTLESSYGSRVVVPGAGFLLNDEMNDFNWLPDVTDTKGRIGTRPNRIVPGKRMVSSMCPTLILRDGTPLLVTGSPGGRTIINTVLGITIDCLDFQRPLPEAIAAPRMHHQWLPDEVRMESGLLKNAESIERLKAMGHTVAGPTRQGDAHSIWIDPVSGIITAAADARSSGTAAGY